MMQERADLGFADALDEFNPADWTPRTAAVNDKPPIAETTQAAALAGFRSREPKPSADGGARERPQTRARRTGRSVQLNLKVRQETVDAFYAVADHHGWGLGETLEHAVALLEREYMHQSAGASCSAS